ncbi:hypothetical protein BC936DRAFT_139447 [Jimgerdemannia flammicorona]|uniref:Guanine nucleotide exchange factor in Golgi transport N-terminal-domain-containing protein n=1 Tax=Jimgerdemannia flammicorona TaxID=994334 RepID=A0A433B9W1_9FUNG|nr:hypothetical protein BC936DRAFT_139447 [Jimgerdemannia flammicorona]
MSTYTAIHDKADIQTVTVAFENFLTNPLAAQGQLTTESKTAFVSALVTDLGDTSLQAKWNDSVRLLAIQTLKTLGREVSGSDRLFSKEGIRVLMKHAGMIPAPSSVKDDSVSQEALKCLSNCLLLLSSTKAMFYENDGVKSSVFYMKWPKLSGDSRFLLSRVLFLMTVDCLDVVRLLIDDLNVADSIALILSENVQSLLNNPAQREGPISREMVISEVLKLLFNLLMHDSRSCRSDDKGKGAPDPRPILGIKTWTEQEEVLIQPAAKFESQPPHSSHRLR